MSGARQPNNLPASSFPSASASAAASAFPFVPVSASVSAFPNASANKAHKGPATPPPPFAAPPPAFDPPAIPPATTLALAPASPPASAAVPRSSLSAAAAAAAASAASAGGAPSSAATPGALAALVARREKLEEQVASAERQLFDLETAYLHDSAHTGSVLRGFDSLLAAPRAASSSMKRPRKFLAEDRLFSLSSCTSSAAEEQATGRDADGRSDLHVLFSSRSKSSGAPGNGPTQRRGRGATPREGKRLRQQVEQVEPEEEEEDCVL